MNKSRGYFIGMKTYKIVLKIMQRFIAKAKRRTINKFKSKKNYNCGKNIIFLKPKVIITSQFILSYTIL